ncbi:MAG: glycosyltransferase [Desulfobulbaceae bacterium]|nr:glycosyltransferase [Desulfobulbaceae bacterium]
MQDEKDATLLSVAMIVKNEEKDLPDCLESIINLSDQIVIVDTGSTDNSKEIALNYGAEVYDFMWCDDFAMARNESLKYAVGQWILYIDADERLSPDSQIFIRNLISTAKPEVGGFITSIVSKYIEDDGSLATYKGKYPRLFRNLGYPDLHFFGKIHEQISPSIYEKGFDIIESEIVIIHEGYAISKAEMNLKVGKNLNILSEHVRKEPENAFSWYQLGNTLYQMKIYDRAIECLENALKCGNLTKFLSANTSLALANMYLSKKQTLVARKCCELALLYIPDFHAAKVLLNHIATLNKSK